MTFVDQNKVAIDTTNKNLSSLGIKNAKVMFMSDEMAIKTFINNKEQFDLLFLDPPYKEGKYQQIISTFMDNNLLSKNAIIVMESDHNIDIDESYYEHRRDYKYGDIFVAILWR